MAEKAYVWVMEECLPYDCDVVGVFSDLETAKKGRTWTTAPDGESQVQVHDRYKGEPYMLLTKHEVK